MGDDKLDVLDKIIDVYSREIKEESDNIRQILLTLFSAYTKNPQNTRILAPSGEGKTYLVTKVSELFPQEHIKMIARATPQSFKYTMSSKKVIENGSGNWQDYDVAIEPLEEELAKTKDKEKQNELKQQIQELRESAYDLVDFTNMIIILVDSQSFELFESLKTTLSHDKDMIQSFSVNKTQSGTMKGQRFLIKGFPAVIYCSAKDEQQKDETNEINTRFNTISLNASTVKYRKMLELEALHSSLPNTMYQEEIISDDEKILSIGKQYGINVIKRPKSLCRDSSSGDDGYLHAIKKIEKNKEKIDLVIGLQATSPIRESLDIEKAIKKFHRFKYDSLISVSPIGDFYIWEKNKRGVWNSVNYNYKNRPRRQNFSPQFEENGSFYFFKPEILRKYKNRIGGNIGVYEMDFWKLFEIDEYNDIFLCEVIMKNYLLKKNRKEITK